MDDPLGSVLIEPPRPIVPILEYNIPSMDVTDLLCSSGMCKAGFAGDDAPRAVFRKYPNSYIDRWSQLTYLSSLAI